jgi:hypothetical protein
MYVTFSRGKKFGLLDLSYSGHIEEIIKRKLMINEAYNGSLYSRVHT